MFKRPKIRVLHCISKLKSGGAQTQLIHLVNGLDKNKYEIGVLCWDSKSALNIDENVVIIHVRRNKSVITLWKDIYQEMKKFNPDLLHLWLPEIMTVPASISGFLLNIKSVSGERRIPTKRIGKLYFRDRIKYLSHVFSTKIVTNFQLNFSGRRVFKLLFYFKKGAVVNNGLDINFLSVYATTIQNHRIKEETRIIYVGRLAEQKNLHLLLIAIQKLNKSGLNIKLDIYGQGELLYELQKTRKKLRIENQVVFKGFVSDWFRYAENYDFFILPSNLEGMPNVLFEAAAVKLPILASDISEINSHFKHLENAILFKPNQSKSIEEAVILALENGDLVTSLIENAFTQVKNYSLQNMIENYSNIYKSILKK